MAGFAPVCSHFICPGLAWVDPDTATVRLVGGGDRPVAAGLRPERMGGDGGILAGSAHCAAWPPTENTGGVGGFVSRTGANGSANRQVLLLALACEI